MVSGMACHSLKSNGSVWKEQVGRNRLEGSSVQGWESVCWGVGWGVPSLENKSSKWPTFPNIKVSEIQSFKFSKLQGFEISKCRSFKATKFHNFELSTIIFWILKCKTCGTHKSTQLNMSNYQIPTIIYWRMHRFFLESIWVSRCLQILVSGAMVMSAKSKNRNNEGVGSFLILNLKGYESKTKQNNYTKFFS